MANEFMQFIDETSSYDKIFTPNMNIYNCLNLEHIGRDKFKTYQFMNVNVPRVNEMLSACIGSRHLFKWVASCGEDYEAITARTLDTGSIAHLMLEDYIKGIAREDLEYLDLYPAGNVKEAHNCRSNFLIWESQMIEKGYKIEYLFIEQQITCPWYGGTIDLIATITDPNGQSLNYVIDFKTSKQIAPEYMIQTTLYRMAVNYHNAFVSFDFPMIDGVGVLRLDKIRNNYECFLVDIYHDKEYIAGLEQTAMSLVNWFWQFEWAKSNTKITKKIRNMKG